MDKRYNSMKAFVAALNRVTILYVVFKPTSQMLKQVNKGPFIKFLKAFRDSLSVHDKLLSHLVMGGLSLAIVPNHSIDTLKGHKPY